jgi:hypothetical protein
MKLLKRVVISAIAGAATVAFVGLLFQYQPLATVLIGGVAAFFVFAICLIALTFVADVEDLRRWQQTQKGLQRGQSRNS